MTIWIDAQLSPSLAPVDGPMGWDRGAGPVRDLGLHTAKDQIIFEAARKAGVMVMTKDSDFLSLSKAFGAPPQILWVTCGNTSNAFLQKVLKSTLLTALKLLSQGEAIVEISA